MHLPGVLATVLLYAATISQAAVISQRLETVPAPLDEVRNSSAQRSLVPVGAIITHCTVPGTIALTFDDGPFIYTAQMLDTLAAHGARATFFLNGVNKGSIDGFAPLVVRALAEGHQLGSHTWGHPSLPTLDYPAIVTQMTDLEAAFLRIVGFFPTYMRTPFLHFNDVVLKAMADLGYHVIGASIDTKDFENDSPDLSWRSFQKFRAELDAGGSIVLAHDVHQTTVEVLVDNMLQEIAARGLTTVTVGQCLGDPPEFWYRTGR
ncbi:Glycoside hydrolase/deacetylase beta/alpha-barrel [Penicillium hispanicum]|uniref:Glycoside hydrolase/deacetylase beta/alpha-barrel n=1 Tax=Penicillium hispanicum TaxID=1080232 RepID=UPI0025409F13|nr:Glycoside hydrolase/deacetylase beta/alpha-barrel [Penicillium hispanicum]KAJ5584211.1 Glycoside hydrolase/deacetylase beta/alpha-barrel [Penicillium hispanicum]